MRTLDNKNKKSDKTKYFYKKVADGMFFKQLQLAKKHFKFFNYILWLGSD